MAILINQSHRMFFFMLVAVLLNGCATAHYGNFIQNPSSAVTQVMADDAAAQIVRLYPPATTQFTIMHAVHDAFGKTLIEKLRAAGFAVQEAAEQSVQQSMFAASQSKTESQGGIQLSYIVDQSEDLYHANLLINDTRLSRAFIARADAIHPAGLWVKKE